MPTSRVPRRATSGQVLLYDASGRLRFRGGIRPSRGHEGDNTGRRALEALLLGDGAAPPLSTAVFGCPLFHPRDATAASSVETLR
jgi:hypothetical protein